MRSIRLHLNIKYCHQQIHTCIKSPTHSLFTCSNCYFNFHSIWLRKKVIDKYCIKIMLNTKVLWCCCCDDFTALIGQRWFHEMLKFCFDVLIYEVRWQRSETKHQSKSFILLHFDADLIRLCFLSAPFAIGICFGMQSPSQPMST